MTDDWDDPPVKIHRFYAVTLSGGLYEVRDDRDENDVPLVTKIDSAGNSLVGIGGRLKQGHVVGVTTLGLIMFGRTKAYQEAGMVNIIHWGGHSSPIVGLFKRARDAKRCLRARNRRVLDPRWREETEEVLHLIGPEHPVFILSTGPDDLNIEWCYKNRKYLKQYEPKQEKPKRR